MNRLLQTIGIFVAISSWGGLLPPLMADDSDYKLGPDSQVKEGVPQGKVTEYRWESAIYEGTERRYYVYVPAQYNPEKPAALMVFQDGHTYVKPDGRFRATIVMDNLIHAGEMPVTIGVFVDPGHRGTLPDKPGWEPRPANRSVEYDTVSDVYASFLRRRSCLKWQRNFGLPMIPNNGPFAESALAVSAP
jgi:hypothetical protein